RRRRIHISMKMRTKKTGLATAMRRASMSVHEQLRKARYDLTDGAVPFDRTFHLPTTGATVGVRQREQRNEPRRVTGLGQARTVAVEIELDESQRAELRIELAGVDSVVKATAGLAPGGTDVDQHATSLLRGLFRFGDDEWRDRTLLCAHHLDL